MPDFKRGDRVEKISGYTFRGVVLSVYQKLNDAWVVDVEMNTEEYRGCRCPNCIDPNGNEMIHIFNPAQLRKI